MGKKNWNNGNMDHVNVYSNYERKLKAKVNHWTLTTDMEKKSKQKMKQRITNEMKERRAFFSLSFQFEKNWKDVRVSLLIPEKISDIAVKNEIEYFRSSYLIYFVWWDITLQIHKQIQNRKEKSTQKASKHTQKKQIFLAVQSISPAAIKLQVRSTLKSKKKTISNFFFSQFSNHRLSHCLCAYS